MRLLEFCAARQLQILSHSLISNHHILFVIFHDDDIVSSALFQR